MLTSIHIQGFKNFKDTQITPLRKVNLILGGQNVGKTSLLEAVYMGASPVGNMQNLPAVFRLAEGNDRQRFLDMTFKGVEVRIALDLEPEFVNQKFRGEQGDHPQSASLVTQVNAPQRGLFRPKVSGRLLLGSLSFDGIKIDRDIFLADVSPSIREDDLKVEAQVNFPLAIPVNLPNQVEAVRLLDQVVLKRKKRTLLDALRRIEPRLEDMHSLSPDGEQRVYLELDGLPTAVPLPQLGHGFSRLLYLYCSLLVTDAKLALVDEVENGIHYASLPILFKGVQDMAATQGVQTLMTTHSWDCIRAAYKTFADAGCLQDFQLIRLEREGDNVRAVVINDDMLDTVMEAGYEVR